jgi:hypothetical protein
MEQGIERIERASMDDLAGWTHKASMAGYLMSQETVTPRFEQRSAVFMR